MYLSRCKGYFKNCYGLTWYSSLKFQFDATRYMYIMVEHPNVIVRGEQIGIRVTVFNYWYDDDYMEVSVHHRNRNNS